MFFFFASSGFLFSFLRFFSSFFLTQSSLPFLFYFMFHTKITHHQAMSKYQDIDKLYDDLKL